ncbi:hypothetical protein D9C73_023572 [Collichthys lucidus]|uniref:Uncharacterized protein n=1 Tax=Collichthys lucidus TaxID=240159 RepID=A0A4U5VLT0_COLLU|nr:hypothetical protein D9C73_023572 [Collichthys lucidus]
MLNVPDYVLEEEETIRMDNEVSVDEEGELRCSDFEVPLFTSETFIDLFLLHLEMLTQEQWDFLAFGKIDLPTVLILTNLCNDIVENVTMEVLEEIEPQCNSANTPVTTNNSELPQRERNLCSVTRADIEASLGDSLNQCFAEVMNVSEKKSEYSEQLRRLVAGEVARNINCRLAVQSTSSKQTEEFVRIETPLANEMKIPKLSYQIEEVLHKKIQQSCSSREDDIVEHGSTPLKHKKHSSFLPFFPFFLIRLTEYTCEYKIEKTMLNVPDYVLEEDETIRMDNEWNFLAFGKIDLPTVLILTNLCNDIVENVTMEVLEEIEPQCNSANTPVTTNNSELPQRERNLCSVTRADIEASLGDSLNQCFAEVMNVSEKKSEYSEQLRRLVAGEVARKINCRLAVQSTSSKQTEEFVRIETPLANEMVRNISKIFTQNLLRKNSSETSEEEEEYLDSHGGRCSHQSEEFFQKKKQQGRSSCGDDIVEHVGRHGG